MFEQNPAAQAGNTGGPGSSGDSGFRLNPRLIGFAVVIVVVGIFVIRNRESTTVDFIIAKAEAPLWVALLLATVAGVALGELGGWLLRRRNK